MPFWSSKKEEAPDKSPGIVEKVEKDGDIRRKYEIQGSTWNVSRDYLLYCC